MRREQCCLAFLFCADPGAVKNPQDMRLTLRADVTKLLFGKRAG